jgi:hypothetical protein
MPTNPKTPGPIVQELKNEFLVAELARFRSPPQPDPRTGGQAFIAAGGTVGAIRRAQALLDHTLEALKQSAHNPHGDDDEALAGEMLQQMRKRRGRWDGWIT